jgi:hypothetical protein
MKRNVEPVVSSFLMNRVSCYLQKKKSAMLFADSVSRVKASLPPPHGTQHQIEGVANGEHC